MPSRSPAPLPALAVVIAVLAGASSSAGAAADSTAAAADTLGTAARPGHAVPEIVVTASRRRMLVAESPREVRVVTGREIRESFVLAARAHPVEMVFYDNQRDDARAIQNAEAAIARRVDLYIQYHRGAAANATIGEKLRAAGIRVLALNYPVPGAPLYTVDNLAAGHVAGEALAQFARGADPTGAKLLVVLVDNAGGPIAKALVVPANVRLYRLPPCTPALQPAEHLWPLVREGMANRDFDHLVALGGKLRRRCDGLASHPEVVQGAVGFHGAVNL